MSLDLAAIKRERHDQIGRIIERDAQQIADVWFRAALDQHPSADPARRDEAYDELPQLLRGVGRALFQAGAAGDAPRNMAVEHGQQRWATGWSVDDVVRDYELLRVVVLGHLETELGEPLSTREVIAVGVVLDEALMSSIVAYTRQVEDQYRAIQSTLEQTVAAQRATIRHTAAELLQSEQRERQRIAAVLHDHFQQVLVAAQMSAGTLRGTVSGAPETEALDSLDDLLREAIRTSRSLAVDLNPPVLQEQGLAAALRWLAERVRQQQGLEVEVVAEDQPDPGDREVRGLLFQAVQELLLNIVKHAGTSRARVEKSRCGDAVQIVVSDDGAGFDPLRLLAEGPTSFGLPTVRQRLELLGGSFQIESALGKGTRATLRLPGYWPPQQ